MILEIQVIINYNLIFINSNNFKTSKFLINSLQFTFKKIYSVNCKARIFVFRFETGRVLSIQKPSGI